MKNPPAFQFYPGDWLSSSRVQTMSIEAEGVYIRLLCYQWQDGFIPNSISTLARLCKISERKMKSLWNEVYPCFDLEIETGKLANKRLEDTRNKQLDYRYKQAEHGKHGAEIKKGILEGTLISTLKGKASTSPSSSPSPPSLSSKGNKKGKEGKGNGSASEKRAERPQDEAANLFISEHLKYTAVPYTSRDGDYVQLSKLRIAYGISGKETPPGWQTAVTNYFVSALGKNSLADLAVRYSVFYNSPVDGFNKPINHQNRGNGNGSQSKTDRNHERTAELLRERYQQNSGGNERGTLKSDDCNVSGPTFTTTDRTDG